VLLLTCLLFLGILPAHAVDRPSLLRAGSGMRRDDIQLQHLTQKAACTRSFLGQTPLFKGEWVPHQVSCPLYATVQLPWPWTTYCNIRSHLSCSWLSHVQLSVKGTGHSLNASTLNPVIISSCTPQSETSDAGSQLQQIVQPGQRLSQLVGWVQLPGGWHRP
jgi:hypothetical protein